MTAAIKKFIGEVVLDCQDHGITFTFSRDEKVSAPGEGPELASCGFFEGNDKILTCSRVTSWLWTLIHEYNHMQQWKEDAWWFSDEAASMWQDFWDWLEKKVELSPEQVQKTVKAIIACERNCEERVISMITSTQKRLGIGKRAYIKQANAYLAFYALVVEKQSWYTKTSPSQSLRLQALVPANRIISVEEALNPSKKFRKTCLEECFNTSAP